MDGAVQSDAAAVWWIACLGLALAAGCSGPGGGERDAADRPGDTAVDATPEDASTDVETDADTPGPPSNLTSPDQTSTTIALAWDGPDGSVPVDHYNIYVDGNHNGGTANRSATVRQLTPDTEYRLFVTAVGDGGAESPPSDELTVRTDREFSGEQVPLLRTFETSVTNDESYSNKFRDVTLEATFTSPSGKTYEFWGFFDGRGDGTGDATTGNVWKLRFLPDELGVWEYEWSFSDDSKSGSGSFECVESGSSPGVIHPYESNPRWFAYNEDPLSTTTGTDPVFLKSYYVHAHASILQDLNWMAPNIYDPLIQKGYNHLQIAGLLPTAHINQEQVYSEGPDPIEKLLYEDPENPATMNLDVWHEMERHLSYLNERDVAVQFFQGFDGKASSGDRVRWSDLSADDREWYVRYVVARLAPYANIAGYNYTWEEDGPKGSGAYELAELLQRHDPWNHGRTYEQRYADKDHYFDLEPYTFAAVENHGTSGRKDNPGSHHEATLKGFQGKPVWMMEGNGLWASFWEATEEDVVENIWAVTVAGGSFCWNALEGRVPHSADDLLGYSGAVSAVDRLTGVMTEDLAWYRMEPHDDLLQNRDTGQFGTHALAEPGAQYLVVEFEGGSFDLEVENGNYEGFWMDIRSGDRTPVAEFSTGGGSRSFSAPGDGDFVLVLTETS